MKIRSLTVFCNPGFPVNRLLLERIGIFIRHARFAFDQAGFEVQSCRLATPPFPHIVGADRLLFAAQALSIESHAEGFDYLSLGPALPDQPDTFRVIPDVISKTENVFFSGILNTPSNEISMSAIKESAGVITKLATLDESGFANLRFAALANVRPFSPFFPSAFGLGNEISFALAIQGADLALDAFADAKDLQAARAELIRVIENNAQKLELVAENLSKNYKYQFKGLDFTLAPFPDQQNSIARALETLGLPVFGLHGSLFSAAFLTDTLDKARYKKIGFNGLMLPVLEDSGLAGRTSEEFLSTTNLLLYSSVCGTGLDVIPLPGDTKQAEFYPVLLDIAALSLRLNKQLTARLLPIPGKHAGEMTEFKFEYFANARVLSLPSFPLFGLLNDFEKIQISSRLTD